MATDKFSLAAALGRVPSGLFIITAAHHDQETGMLASWVMQCAFDPPMLTVGMKKGRPITEWLTEHAVGVVVNIVPEDGKKFIARFGKGFSPDEPAFEELPVDRDRACAPVLLEAAAYLDCMYHSSMEAGDHVVVLLRIVGGEILNDGKPYIHLRKNGLGY